MIGTTLIVVLCALLFIVLGITFFRERTGAHGVTRTTPPTTPSTPTTTPASATTPTTRQVWWYGARNVGWGWWALVAVTLTVIILWWLGTITIKGLPPPSQSEDGGLKFLDFILGLLILVGIVAAFRRVAGGLLVVLLLLGGLILFLGPANLQKAGNSLGEGIARTASSVGNPTMLTEAGTYTFGTDWVPVKKHKDRCAYVDHPDTVKDTKTETGGQMRVRSVTGEVVATLYYLKEHERQGPFVCRR